MSTVYPNAGRAHHAGAFGTTIRPTESIDVSIGRRYQPSTIFSAATLPQRISGGLDGASTTAEIMLVATLALRLGIEALAGATLALKSNDLVIAVGPDMAFFAAIEELRGSAAACFGTRSAAQRGGGAGTTVERFVHPVVRSSPRQ
jgi:hypothetical protein